MTIYLYPIFLLLTIVIVIYALYLRYKRKRYTRERYAFAALSSTIILATLIIATIFDSAPWEKLIYFIFAVSGKEYTQNSSTWAEKLLVLTFGGYVIYIINSTFLKWNGQKSVRQHTNEVSFKNHSIISDSFFEIRRLVKRNSTEVYNESYAYKGTVKIETPVNNLAWRDEVRELVELKWSSYRFDSDKDWHEIGNCWIGVNYKSDKRTCLLCCNEEPSENQILNFHNYCNEVKPDKQNNEYIVVYKSGKNKTKTNIGSDTIKLYSNEYLLDTLVNFDDYFYDIKKRIQTEGQADSEIKLLDSYVKSDIKISNTEEPQVLEEYLINWLKEKSNKQLSVLGEYGQGKSTGLLIFTYNLICNIKDSNYIPILIELRGKSPSTLQPIELLGAWASPYRIDPKALFKLMQQGRLLIIFEGFDEMAQVGDSEARINHFRSIWKFCYKNSKMIITGRPNFFFDDTELKVALGIEESISTGPFCEALHLQPFTIEKIEKSLRWLSTKFRKEIINLAKNDSNFYDIVSRPSLLFIVGVLWKEKEIRELQKNINSATVMSLFVNHSLRRQIEKQSDGRKFMALNESERRYFSKGISAYMASKNLQNQILPSEFNEAIFKLYEQIPLETSGICSIIRDEPKTPLKERLQDKVNAIDELQTDVRTHGLLVRDFSRVGALKYPHKSFYEYLFAEYLFDGINKSSEYLAIYKATHANYDKVIKWKESLDFLGELFKSANKKENDKSRLASLLFRKIVNSNASLLTRFYNRLYLTDVVNRVTTPKRYRIFAPSLSIRLWIMQLVILPPFFLSYFSIFNKGPINETLANIHVLLVHYLIYIIPLIFASFMIYFIMLKVFKSNRAQVSLHSRFSLWLSLIDSIGITKSDLKNEFGNSVSNALPKLHEYFAIEVRDFKKVDG